LPTPLSLRCSLVAVGAAAVAAWLVVPRAFEAGSFLAAEDDPVRIAELGVDRSLDAARAGREIEAALAAGDSELAESFVALARERNIAVDPALLARVAAAGHGATAAVHSVGQFVRGFFVGEPEDLASLAGTATGDLFVFGDARDAVREGFRLARGEDADELILGLACVGLAITAGTYATVGASMPARMGLSVIKAARRSGRMGAKLSGAFTRAARQTVDTAALKQAFTETVLMRPAAAVRAARVAVKAEKAGDLLHLVGNVGRLQAKAGTRAALDGLKLAESPKELARVVRVAEAKGVKTRAVIKLLGRGAILLTTGVFTLANWVLWGVINLLLLCVMIKRSAERLTSYVIARRKRDTSRQRALAMPAASP